MPDQTPPQTLAELAQLFAENDYELGDSRFELRPDFTTRFVFHHLEGDKVAVRIGLPPHYGANRGLHLQLGLLLPIPENLRPVFMLAHTGHQGFLMKNVGRIFGSQVTKFSFQVGRNKKHPE